MAKFGLYYTTDLDPAAHAQVYEETTVDNGEETVKVDQSAVVYNFEDDTVSTFYNVLVDTGE